MKNKLLLLTLFFALTSCQKVILKLYGIKKPKIENEKTIRRKAYKFKLDTSNIVTVNSNDFLYKLKGQSIPDGAIYNKNGKHINYKQSDSSCNAGLFQFIPSLSLNETYKQSDKSDLKTELNKFRDLKGNLINVPNDADFYLLIYWTVWAGKLNKDHVKIWENLARDNKNCRIKVIKVNLDLQEYWDEKERDKIIKAISKKKNKPQ